MNFRSTKIEPSFLYALLLPVFLFPLLLKGQSPVIKGKVFGAEHDPLPFVHIRFDQGNVGTTSNIDGNFTFPFNVKRLNFSYIGYKTLELPVEVTKDGTLEIEMIPDNTLLSTVEVHPGKNPANTIMERVLEMSDRNNPEHFGSYQYSSYHKFWLSTELADGSQKSGKSPISQSELTKLQKRFESNHMLLIETLSRKKFLQPNHENEEILSSSVSGLKKETFFLLANQLQSFSVYRENFRMLSHDYLSPISKSALRNYAFVLEDTLMTDKGDSLFLIRFHPAKGRNFDGLKGFLQINTHGYAVQSVIAEPSQIEKREIYASIWQHYDQLESGQWFPSELNAAINFKIISSLEIDSLKKRKPLLLSVTANSRSYLFDRSVNLPLEAKSFPKYGITVAEGGRDTLSAAGKFRFIPLTPKDSATYQYLDSLGNKIRLNQKVRLIHALSLGTIPIGPVSLNFMYLFGYNINEGYKLGLGVETNRSFSRHFAAGSYFTYGTKDGEFFYGEWLRAFPTGRSDFKIQLDYRNMKREYGVEELLTDYNIFEPEYFRSLLITNMYHTKCYTASVEFRPVEPLNLKIFTDNATEIRLPYGNFSERRWTPFDLTRAGLEIRYSPGITFLNDRDELIQNTPPKADLYF
ncbi:MAG: DUF5686 and carboxypeptidase regulatory-like domain-containing protein, partial [Marinilabiliales bacterium]|nr:DUF5686 and carboxypeptidase regulatory-like domain-containing protein [Marinilabiliales bacterium]